MLKNMQWCRRIVGGTWVQKCTPDGVLGIQLFWWEHRALTKTERLAGRASHGYGQTYVSEKTWPSWRWPRG
jgi:hypothetical protein